MPDVPTWLLCVDPGLVTGLAIVAHYPPPEGFQVVASMEGHMSDIGECARGFLRSQRPPEAGVVIERFTITEKTVRNTQAPWSLKVIGCVEWLVYDVWHVDPEDVVVFQSPAEAKRLVDNKMLREAGLWHRGGAGHANDAIRHGIRRFATLGVYDLWTDPGR